MGWGVGLWCKFSYNRTAFLGTQYLDAICIDFPLLSVIFTCSLMMWLSQSLPNCFMNEDVPSQQLYWSPSVLLSLHLTAVVIYYWIFAFVYSYCISTWTLFIYLCLLFIMMIPSGREMIWHLLFMLLSDLWPMCAARYGHIQNNQCWPFCRLIFRSTTHSNAITSPSAL